MKGMPPRARARTRSASGPAALSEADVALLREHLESGKKPRVMLLVDTALGAAGTSVPVVSFGDPAVGEYISIQLRDDVVPFSPQSSPSPSGDARSPRLPPRRQRLPQPRRHPRPAGRPGS